ncbi:MAG TPA: nucleoside monophosphate kinase, partial [Candidatus Polarisedimenticolia bacterium]|nr:nucleoside monophosphate kinase [Candidatus Polarisedimenticolia bacterium]
MRVVLLGPPGVGKGTQGRRLATGHGWALISTGEMLRDAIAKRTPLGIEAGRLVDAGQLVGDEVMVALVKERSGMPDAATGFVMDGYPRTVPQAE